MEANWNAGDMALCIKGSEQPWFNAYGLTADRWPKRGHTYLVTGLRIDGGGGALALAGLPHYYRTRNFTKAEPGKVSEVRRALVYA